MINGPEDTTPIITKIFWRRITRGDFFNIERSSQAAPQGGGGQLYIDIPLGGNVSLRDFGDFFFNEPLHDNEEEWESIILEVASISAPVVSAPVKLTPRRGLNRRYRIANQNRQAAGRRRHPAWSATRGFPRAPDDVASTNDPRMPDLSFLKIFFARTDRGEYFAGFSNSAVMPASWPRSAGLDALFEPNTNQLADGIIEIASELQLSPVKLGGWTPSLLEGTEDGVGSAFPKASVLRKPSVSARDNGASARESTDSEIPRTDASDATTPKAPRASEAEDWIENHLRKKYCDSRIRRIGHTKLEREALGDGLLPGADLIVLDKNGEIERFAEVKSASKSVPAFIRLTSTELQRAKQCAAVGLPYDIWIVVFQENTPNFYPIEDFQAVAAQLTIDELYSIVVRIKIDLS